MKNSIVFEAKGQVQGATVMPKGIGSYCTAWELTEKLNPGLYTFPSGSKFVTYRVTAGESVADARRAERQAKREANGSTPTPKAKKAPAKVLQLANALSALSATDKALLASLIK